MTSPTCACPGACLSCAYDSDATPSDAPERIEQTRLNLLFGDGSRDEADAMTPEASNYWLLAISALEQAQRFAELSRLAMRRARAEHRT